MTTTRQSHKPPLRAILFDLGDTIVRCHGPWPQLLERAVDLCHEYLSQRWPGLSREQLLRAVEQVVDHRLHELERGHRAFPARERVAAVLGELGIEPEPALLDDLVKRLYAPVSECSDPVPGAREVLSRVKRAGLRLGAVSNTPWDVPGELVERDLIRFGLRDYFDALVFSAAGLRKPHAQIFRRALAALDTGAAETVMVGDSLAEDIAGARALGMQTLWVTWRQGRPASAGNEQTHPAPDYIAEDLRQAGDIILGLISKEV